MAGLGSVCCFGTGAVRVNQHSSTHSRDARHQIEAFEAQYIWTDKLPQIVGLRAASACVTQDDVLPGTSTVWEHLLFHATLRMPIGTSTNALRRRVGQTMRDLGIEKLADSLIGDQFSRGLSGGEKRRVSIATELLMSPGIMFLDEPTTGLDSTNAAKVVDILSKLGSRHGVTVLLSIHQPRPDIFRLLDRILIL